MAKPVSPHYVSKNQLHRRDFLKGALLVGASAWVGLQILRAATVEKAAPSRRINLAGVGIGYRGGDIIKALHATGLANIVALCDVDMGAKHTQALLELFPNVPRFQDFRQMFDKMGSQIEAVSVGTPDFSHFPIAMLAMSLGKHVYCEKPMGQTFQQLELMMAAEQKYKVACQMGNQGHSEANYFQFKAWTEAGIIKNVTKITAFMNERRRWHGMTVAGPLPAQPLPSTLDWSTWIGTAPERDYNVGYVNGDWRSWYDYGNGALGDWGAHIFDTAHEFLHLGLPTEVDPVLIEGHSPFIFPQATTLSFKFPARGSKPPVELTWYDGQQNLPPLPENFGSAVVDPNIPPPTSGKIDTKKNPPGKVIYADGLVFKGGSHATTLQILAGEKAKDITGKLPEVPKSPSNHFANFLLSAMGEEKCRSAFRVAAPLCQAMSLGIIAQRLNTKIAFDPATKKIINNKIANELLVGPPPRKDWEQFYKL